MQHALATEDLSLLTIALHTLLLSDSDSKLSAAMPSLLEATTELTNRYVALDVAVAPLRLGPILWAPSRAATSCRQRVHPPSVH